MGGQPRGTFIGEVPEMRIEGGLVHIVSDGQDYYMRPSTVRKYIARAQMLLAKWDCEQMGVVPLRPKEPHR